MASHSFKSSNTPEPSNGSTHASSTQFQLFSDTVLHIDSHSFKSLNIPEPSSGSTHASLTQFQLFSIPFPRSTSNE